MINIALAIICFVTINSLFMNNLLNRTQYRDHNYPDSSVFIILIFGVLCFLFIEKIKKIRKNAYYKAKLYNLEKFKSIGMILDENNNLQVFDEETKKELIKIKRILALKKIKRKNLFKF